MATKDPTRPASGSSNTAKLLVAPVATLAADWGVRKALDTTYRRSTGRTPPRASDPTASLSKVIVWAAVTAATLAIVNVVIDRLSARVSPPS